MRGKRADLLSPENQDPDKGLLDYNKTAEGGQW